MREDRPGEVPRQPQVCGGVSREHGQGRQGVSLGSGGWDGVLSMSAEQLTCPRLVSVPVFPSWYD